MFDVLLNHTEIRSHASSAWSIVIFAEIPSTNAEAVRIAREQDSCYTAVIADMQSAGCGRMGRSFFSPRGTGIYLSAILPCDSAYMLKVTPAISVAVCRTIETFSADKVELKWVNDVLMRGRKVCGILCESILEKGVVVAGIGINFATAAFPDEIVDTAGSVFPENVPVSRNEFIGCLLKNLYEVSLDYGRCISEYRSRSCVLGKAIRYSEAGIWHDAVAVDIDGNGGLVVQEDEVRKTLISGEISLRYLSR